MILELNKKLKGLYNIYMRSYCCDLKYKRDKKEHATSLNNEQWDEIKTFWKPYIKSCRSLPLVLWGGVRCWFSAYNTSCDKKEKLKYYLPEIIYYPYIDAFFTHPQEASVLDDKNNYDMYFQGIPMPETIVRKMRGLFLDKNYHLITATKALELIKSQQNVVCKESVSSQGGKGVKFFDLQAADEKELLDWMRVRDNIIVQKVIGQHSELSRLHSDSINTVRVMTLTRESCVEVISCVLRMGIGGSRVDNASSGGIVCGINPDGRLKNEAWDVHINHYDKHPQGTCFESVVVPAFDQCKALACDLAPKFMSATRLISWDFAISEQGTPVLIEANLSFGELDFHQMCNGPLFGDKTEEILKEVFSKTE